MAKKTTDLPDQSFFRENTEELLQRLKEAKFPQSKVGEGQIWYDCHEKKYGIVIGNSLNYFGGGFAAFSDASLKHGEFLLCPSVQQLLLLTPNARVEIWGGQFSVKIDDDEHPERFLSDNLLEACARAYLSLFAAPQQRNV
jgi:hypothetical protein